MKRRGENMIHFIISVSDFNDAVTLEQWDVVSLNVEWAQKVIESGGKVIVEQRFKNGSIQTIKVIQSVQDLKNWKKVVAETIEQIKNIKKD